jgi:hypothetical protein
MREKRLLKILKKALENDHLYTSDELLYMREEANNLKKIVEENTKKNNKGFGY